MISGIAQILISISLYLVIHVTKSIDINIGGIFKVNSIGETAFSFAILKHNQRPGRKFRLISTLAMLKEFESNIIMRKICQQTSENDVVAIFGGNFSFVIQEINDVSNIIQIPFFTTDLDIFQGEISNKTESLSYLVHMHPQIIDALVDYLIGNEWFTFSYICNSGQGLYRLQNVIKNIHSNKDYIELNIDVRYISDPRLATKDLRNLDSYLDSQEEKRILIDVDTKKNLEIILHRIVLMGMNRPEYQYIILSTCIDEIDLDEFQYSGVRILGFKILTENNKFYKDFKSSWNEWFTQSGNSNAVDHLYEAALMMDAINTLVTAIERIMENPNSNRILMSYLKNKNNVDCYTNRTPGRRKMIGYQNREYKTKYSKLGEMILNNIINLRSENGLTGTIEFTKYGLRQNYTVQILKVEIENGPIVIGEWTSIYKLKVKAEHQNNYARELIRNKTLRVVSIESKPFLQKKIGKDNERFEGNDRYEGFCVDLLNYTASMLNFKYEIHLVNDNNYGANIGLYPNGTEIWNGMIGELLNGTADIAVAPLTLNLARAKVVHFSEPFLTFGLSVMIKKPGKKKAGIFSFLMPLSNEVWGCYLAACLVVSGGLYIIARMSPYEWNITEPYSSHQKIKRDFTFFNSLWFSIAAFVQQGVDVAPKSPGARILSSVWWFFTLIMIAYYTANLAAFLTISLMITPINDWPDLVKPTVGIEYGTLNSGSTKNFFLTTILEPYKSMGKFMEKNPHVFHNTIDEGVKRVRKSKGNYAFILESPMNDYFNNRLPCDTMMVGTPYGDKGYGIATSLNYPHKEELTDAILKLREKQEITKLYKRWWVEKGECKSEDSKSNSGALLLINVAGVFYILAGGLTFAMLTSLVEFYCNNKKFEKKHQTKENMWYSTSGNCSLGPYPMIFSDQNKPLRLAEHCSISAHDI